MAIQISPNLPANVVEIGNEITQAKIDEINAGTLALQTWVSASYLTSATASSTYAPKASPTFTGTVTIPAGASISGYLTTSSASSTYQTIAGMSSYLTTATASSTYAPKASPTFTGTVTIPAGASISGYLTTSSASSTYQTISGMSSYATQSYVTSQGYLTDAPSNGSEYVRKNGAWAVATGGGGGGVAWGAITGTVTDQTDLTSYISGLGYITDAPVGSDYIRNNNAWALLSDRGYQTATDVSTYVTGLGYQTATDVSTYVTGLGYITSTGKSVNTLSGNYTLASTDANNIIYVPTGGGGGFPLTITLPDDGTYNFPVGTVIMLCVDNTTSGTSISFSTTLMGTPNIVGSLAFSGISSTTSGQWFITKLASNLWIIS